MKRCTRSQLGDFGPLGLAGSVSHPFGWRRSWLWFLLRLWRIRLLRLHIKDQQLKVVLIEVDADVLGFLPTRFVKILLNISF